MILARWLAGLGLAALLGVGCRIDPGAFDDVAENSDGQLHYRWTDDGYQLDVLAKGDLTFNDDYSDLVSLSEGGLFSVEESSDDRIRKYELRRQEDGNLIRTFAVDGKPRDPGDPDLRPWLAQVLPRVLRETGFDAAERVRRLRKQGGAPRVLEEISQIESGTSRTLYLEELVESGPLEEREVSLALRETEKVFSNGELGRLLQRLSTQHPGSLPLTMELIEASRRLESSGERRRVIERIVQERDLDAAAARALAHAVAEMRSDSERAQAILSVAERSPRDAETAKAFFDAAATIRSSSEKGRVYRELLAKPGLSDAVLAEAARGIAGITSSSEKGLALVKLGEILRPEGEAAATAFFDAVATIENVSEREHVISTFVARGDLNSATLRRSLAFVRISLPEGPLRQRLVDKIERKLADG